MNFPYPGMKVFIESDGQLLEFLDNSGEIQTVKNIAKAVTNLDYEIRENEKKRSIQILKPELVGVFVGDTRNMMKYDTSSQYIDKQNKRTYNPRNNR